MITDRVSRILMAIGMVLIACTALLTLLGLAGCTGAQVKAQPAVQIIQPPEAVRIEQVVKEVPSPISKDVVARFPCAYPEGRPLNEFYTVDDAKTKCLKEYESIISGLIAKYGVKQ